MFQHTIQDVFALAEASGRVEDLLLSVRTRLSAFEAFESGELRTKTTIGESRFEIVPGRAEIGRGALELLGNEVTLRFDTASDLAEKHLAVDSGLSSLLILRLEATEVSSAAIILGHTRSWSFAATPLSRIRTIGNVALRLILAGFHPDETKEGIAELTSEVARLRTKVSTLESEIKGLQADRLRRGSGKPQ